MKTASWVVIEKESKRALFETYDRRIVAALNTDKYEAVPIMEYLQNLNVTLISGRPTTISAPVVSFTRVYEGRAA